MSRLPCLILIVMYGAAAGVTAQDSPKPIDPGQLTKELDKTKSDTDAFKGGLGGAGKGAGFLKTALDAAVKGQDLLDAFKPLTPDDAGYDPTYAPAGMPQIPARCAESNRCGDCFEKAYGELNAVRVRFEKLRRLYQSTAKFITKALAFGDSASGIHGITGLAWQTERFKIEQSAKTLDASYDAKYAELVAALTQALQHMAGCEAAHFNEPDWYNRFGFMYYSFMVDRYKR